MAIRRYTDTPFSFINLVFDLLEALLVLRFFLVFFGANAATPVVSFIYNVSLPLIAPFRGIFPNTVAGGFTFEWSTFVAMIVYALIASLVLRLIVVLSESVHEEVHHHA